MEAQGSRVGVWAPHTGLNSGRHCGLGKSVDRTPQAFQALFEGHSLTKTLSLRDCREPSGGSGTSPLQAQPCVRSRNENFCGSSKRFQKWVSSPAPRHVSISTPVTSHGVTHTGSPPAHSRMVGADVAPGRLHVCAQGVSA